MQEESKSNEVLCHHNCDLCMENVAAHRHLSWPGQVCQIDMQAAAVALLVLSLPQNLEVYSYSTVQSLNQSLCGVMVMCNLSFFVMIMTHSLIPSTCTFCGPITWP